MSRITRESSPIRPVSPPMDPLPAKSVRITLSYIVATYAKLTFNINIEATYAHVAAPYTIFETNYTDVAVTYTQHEENLIGI